MAKLIDALESSSQSVMIYGAPFTGKSTLASQLSEHFKLIWVDLEKGRSVLRKLPREWQERVELISLPDTSSYPIAIETCLKMVKGPVDICDTHGKVGCAVCKKENAAMTSVNLKALGSDTIVVFDTLTQLTNSAIAHITKGKPDEYKMEWDEWRILGNLLHIFLSHIQQASYHSVVISHEAESENVDGTKFIGPVGGTKNFSRNLSKYFDHVVHAKRKLKKHTFASSTGHDTRVICGSRSDISLETQEKYSLLPIFKPELAAVLTVKQTAQINPTVANTNPVTKPTVKVNPNPVPLPTPKPIGDTANANNILNRLKNIDKSDK